MADKFILTGELQLRLGSTATVLKDLKTLSKDIIVGIDKAYFDKSVKYMKESLDSVPNIKVSVDKKILRESIKQASDLIKDKKFTIYGKLKLSDIRETKKEIKEKFDNISFKIKAKFDFSGLKSDLKEAFKGVQLPGIAQLEGFHNAIESIGNPNNISGIKDLASAFSSLKIDKDTSIEIRKLQSSLKTLLKIDDNGLYALDNLFRIIESLKLPYGITGLGSLAANISALSRVAKDHSKISKLTNALIPFLNLPFNNATNVGNMFNNLNTNVNSAPLVSYNKALKDFVKTSSRAAPKVTALANSFYDLKTALTGLSAGNPQISFNGINTSAIKSTSSLLANLATKNKAVAEGIREVGSEMEMLGRQAAESIRRFGAYTFATAIFFKLTGAIRSSLDEAIAFEKEVYKIVQVTKLSKTTIGDLVREVDRLSTSYGVSSSKILNSSLVIAQAGFSASETTKILESLAKTE